MDVFLIILSMLLLAVLTYRGMPVILASLLCACGLCLAFGIDPYIALTETMLPGVGGFFTSYLLIFLLGALLSEIMKASNATEAIASVLFRFFGEKYVMIALCLLGTLICLSGISMYVAFFACTPIAISMLKKADLPRRLWIGAWTAGTCTYAMTGPFAPTMQNAVGVKYLGTTMSAGWEIGLIGWIPFAIIIFVYEYMSGMRAKKRGEHFVVRPDETFTDDLDMQNKPHWILPLIPIAALFIMVNIFNLAIETGMLAATIITIICLWNHLPHDGKTINAMISTAFNNATLAVVNPAMIVGFAAVVTSTPTFISLTEKVAGAGGDPMITAAALAGLASCLSGSCVAGLSVAFPTCVQMFGNSGLNLETLHRVATMGAGTIDSLPHSGALHGYAAITKEKMRDVYGDVFVVSVLCPLGATAVSIIAAYLLNLVYV